MSITVRALAALPALTAGDDLVGLLLAAWADGPLDGDLLTVSSKAVAKVEGRVLQGASRDDAIDAEADREVARREGLRIVRTRHGLVLAGAGVDESNTEAGSVVLLPADPDASARRLRTSLAARTGRNVAVIVTDTAGRAWRTGQTDIAIGAAGLQPLHELAGLPDGWGRPLAVTAPAVADELAGAAELVLGKAARTPGAVVSGLAGLVLPAGAHGRGAASLVRPEGADLFGLGAAEAVTAAVRRAPGDRRGFADDAVAAGRPVLDVLGELAAAAVDGQPRVSARVVDSGDGSQVVIDTSPAGTGADTDLLVAAGAVAERLRVLGWAAGLRLVSVHPPPGAVCALTVHAGSVH